MRGNQIIQIFFIGALLLMASNASYALVITSPINGQTFQEGDTVNIVAELSAGDPEILYVTFNTTGAFDNCDEISTHPRYECTIVIPPASPSTITIGAIAKTVNGIVRSPKITISISLPSNVVLQSLKSFTGNTLFFSMLGQKKKLYVQGVYSDNIERDLDFSSGTTYQSLDPKIVEVDSSGMVTAIGTGKTVIRVTNGNKELKVHAVVELKK